MPWLCSTPDSISCFLWNALVLFYLWAIFPVTSLILIWTSLSSAFLSLYGSPIVLLVTDLHATFKKEFSESVSKVVSWCSDCLNPFSLQNRTACTIKRWVGQTPYALVLKPKFQNCYLGIFCTQVCHSIKLPYVANVLGSGADGTQVITHTVAAVAFIHWHALWSLCGWLVSKSS